MANAGADQFAQTLTTLTFSGAASSDPDGSITAYAWTFGDGAAATGVSVSHAYATAGTYTVTLTVTDNGGVRASDTALATISDRPPVANAGPDQTAAMGTAVTLNGSGSTDPDGTITAYSWTFGDGATGSGMSMSHAYAAAGVYTATLTVTDNLGARGTDSAVVTVSTATTSGQALWSKRLGGTGDDFSMAVATDGNGNVVVGGAFSGTADFGTGPLSSNAGSWDGFVVKYTASGTPLWARRFGGPDFDMVLGVAVDGSGNVVVTGYFTGTVDFGTGALTSAGAKDVFVAKYSPTGAPLWAIVHGGPYDDRATAVAVDGSGNVVITGCFGSAANFGGGWLGDLLFGTIDTFVAKYDATGAYVWAKNFPSTSEDCGNAIAVDSASNVVIAGYFFGQINFGGGSLSGAGDHDLYVAKLTPAGGYVWARSAGAPYRDDANGVAVDGSGNVLLTGVLTGPVDLGTGPLHSALGLDYSQDLFVAKYSATGVPLWAKRMAGTLDVGNAVAADSTGNVVVSGYFMGTTDFGTGALTSAGSQDIVVAKYSAAGAPVWVKRIGAAFDDSGKGVAVDRSGNVLATGYFGGGTVDCGNGPLTSAGFHDGLLVKYAP